MSELISHLKAINTDASVSKSSIVAGINASIALSHYTIVELNDQKPWGAYFRFNHGDADRFVEEFFPGLNAIDARLGNKDLELSPKILLVSPGQRLSWQYHNRRAERWAFLNNGFYHRSKTDDEGERQTANVGDVVQFAAAERHRLVGATGTYTLVAEIWQHTVQDSPSVEADIVRLQDDYARSE